MKRLRSLYAAVSLGCLYLLLAAMPIPRTAAQEATPTATPTVEASNTVLIWWPSAIYPDENSTAAALLSQYLSRYQREANVQITIRVKHTEGAGSIYSTLRHANVVAPSVVPDLALLRRSDLLAAANEGLLTAIDPTTLALDDLFSGGLSLGVIDSTQYGIPYLMDAQHTVYRRNAFEEQPLTLSQVLNAGQSFLFPANGERGVNATLMAQYLSLGGRLKDEQNIPLLDEIPLTTVFNYYELAAKRELITPTWFDYATPDQYMNASANSKASMWVVNATNFLGERPADASTLGYSPLPTATDARKSVTSVDGWLWVVTTTDPAQRQQALDAMQWLMESERHGAFTNNLGWLPSRRSSLEAWHTNYATFAETLLNGDAVPPADTINPKVSTAMQSAFEDVVNGNSTAALAAQAAVAQVAQGQ